ncbi:MAG: hypothetical protein ACHQCE_17070 [Streptosporangiales bacterium]
MRLTWWWASAPQAPAAALEAASRAGAAARADLDPDGLAAWP